MHLAARYFPGGGGAVGGDWYDAFLLPDGRLALAVGDVAGHGLAAAAAMGQFRNALRAYLIDSPEPADALRRLNRLAHQLLPTEMATAIVAVVSPDDRSVTLAMAGHLPPLLVSVAGSSGSPSSPSSADYVPITRTPALGLAAVSADAESPSPGDLETVFTMPADATLLFFTDGLIEARGESIDAGLDRLRTLSLSSDGSAEGLCDLALSLVGGDDSDAEADDVAVLAMQIA